MSQEEEGSEVSRLTLTTYNKATKLKYPKSVFFIVSNEFCERFTYYGMRTILALYLRDILMYSDEDATVIYHIFTMLCYFFPLIGAIIADSYLGKFKTIFYLSIVYVLGSVVISISSSPVFGLPQRVFSLLGLMFTAIGTGGIKPCVSSFGGDQFVIPDQAKQLAQFFSIFYFSINAGSLLSTYLTPILRLDVHCLGADSCYPLAFGVPALLMIIATGIFLFGKSLYKIKEPQGNIIVETVSCISHAVSRKITHKGTKKDHWLDYAENKYSKQLISDTKAVLQVLVLYIPLPFFWALFDQQGSRWTFQATRMDGRIGWFTIYPDQMQVVNPVLILLFIPLFESLVYPALATCRLLTKPLQRLSTGGFLAALAFLVSALLETQLEGTYAVLPDSGTSQLRLYNGINCNATVTSQIEGLSGAINSLGMLQANNIPFDNKGYQLSVTFDSSCKFAPEKSWSGNVSMVNSQSVSYFISSSNLDSVTVRKVPGNDTISKSDKGNPQLRVLYNLLVSNITYLNLVGKDLNEAFNLEKNGFSTTQHTLLQNGKFTANIGSTKIDVDMDLGPAGVYTLVVTNNLDNTISGNVLVTSPPNSIHILWLLPQYFIITAAEIMFSITGVEFSYTQAPASMKSLISAAWLLTVSFGNLIVVIISEAKFFQSQAKEFLLFAALMVVDMIIFVVIALRYKYYVPENTETGELTEKVNDKPNTNGS